VVDVLAGPLVVGVHLEFDFLAVGLLVLLGFLHQFAEGNLVVDVVHELVFVGRHDQHERTAHPPVDQMWNQVQLRDLTLIRQLDFQRTQLGSEWTRIGNVFNQSHDVFEREYLPTVHLLFRIDFDLSQLLVSDDLLFLDDEFELEIQVHLLLIF